MTNKLLRYGAQDIDQADIDAVVEVLKSDYLTTGPIVKKFEEAVKDYNQSNWCVAVNSGTSALHCAMQCVPNHLHKKKVIVPAISFVATASVPEICGKELVFCDVNPDTLCIDEKQVEELVSKNNVCALISVDYAGQTPDLDTLQEICYKNNVFHIGDCAQSLGTIYKGACNTVGRDVSCFSFHPVKTITTGEGGACVTDDDECFEKIFLFRSHGVTVPLEQRGKSPLYDVKSIGLNYRMSDIHAALGLSQMKRAEDFICKRANLDTMYRMWLKSVDEVKPLEKNKDCSSAHHLFVVRLQEGLEKHRLKIYTKMMDQGIQTNVHYSAINTLTYYKKKYNAHCPNAEKAAESILTLPLHVHMVEDDVIRVVETLEKVISEV